MLNELEEITSIVKNFIVTYLDNSGCKNLVIGLSGGIDSAVAAVLCRQSVGKTRTLCVFLPDDATPEIDIKHVKTLVDKYDLLCETKDITNIVKEVKKNCILKPDKLALANVKARLRMVTLFEYANMTNSLVCGTSNKSEILVGYFTKYGDGGVDIQPLGDIYKTKIWELAKHLDLPKEIIDKPPSAGLIKDQTDEKELKMSYEDIDKILYGLEQKLEIKKIAEKTGISKSDIERIRQMRIKSQHKRRSPLIPKIGLRTPGLDWRSPILEG